MQMEHMLVLELCMKYVCLHILYQIKVMNVQRRI